MPEYHFISFKHMKKRIILSFVVTLALAVLVLVSCSSEGFSENGNLTLEIDNSLERGIQTTSLNPDYYTVRIYYRDTEMLLIDEVMDPSETHWEYVVAPGFYKILVSAYNNSDICFAYGEAYSYVIPGQVCKTTVRLSERSGIGSVEYVIHGKEGRNLSCIAENPAGEQYIFDFAFSSGCYSCICNLQNGFYVIKVINEMDGNVIDVNTVRTIADSTTRYEAWLFDNGQGSTVLFEQEFVPCGVVLTVNVASQINVSATISGFVCKTCAWILDGKMLGHYGPYEDLILTSLDAGVHTVALLVSDGNSIIAGFADFTFTDVGPSSRDSDGDGLSDLVEQMNGTDPYNADTDNDGLTDYEELLVYFTNPLVWDTDGDGASDGWEVANGYDPYHNDDF